jgi:PcRGLX-like N-terminal RIFT barrel domain
MPPPTIHLRVTAGLPRTRRTEPVAIGVPFPRGLLGGSSSLRLEDSSGMPIPLQSLVLDRWSDDSARWVLLRWQATAEGEALYRVRPADHQPAPAPAATLVCKRVPGGLRVVAAGTVHEVVEGGPLPFEIRTIDTAGQTAAARSGSVELEESGPLFTRVRVECAVDDPLRGSLNGTCRLSYFAGSRVIRADLTLRNPRRARHRGGYWELGDAGSLLLRGASVRFTYPEEEPSSLAGSIERGAPERAFALPFELLQESSGGENWQSRAHVNRDGVVPLRFRGYRVRAGGEGFEGLRAEPIVRLGSLSLSAPRFWQNFPKALEVDARGITLHLFPERWCDLHEIQGGEQKTYSFFFCFGADGICELPLEWSRDPLRVAVDPDWCCSTGAVPYLLPSGRSPEPAYEALVRSAIEGPEGFFAKRERSDEYGWRNFGDLHADHEEAYYSGRKPIVSHYNNQYDAIAGFAIQFLRSGDPRWFELMDDLAAHVADVDVYHTDGDKAAYNHGLFWHTFHYVDAGRSTHRGYPRLPGVPGGGPSNEHDYTSGLVLHHFLTGGPLSRETALEIARWVIDMDDGRRTIFRWLARGPTGLASQTRGLFYHGPGRGAGNSINTLLDAFQLTRSARFLDKAEELIRRCVHPEDDIASRDLGDVEARWSYTVFLQKLGRYLDLKRELAQFDAKYAWARDSLLHYARWMVEHEYPYLQKPNILEYPTETWAAQEIRKSEVFRLAARHTSGEERRRFLDSATFFLRVSLDSLREAPTRTYTRPLAILITNAAAACGCGDDMPPESRPSLPEDFTVPGPVAFFPQKALALCRIRTALIAGALGTAALLLWYLTSKI